MATATAAAKRMFIDGQWCDAADGRTLGVINPATEEIVHDIAYGSRKETAAPWKQPTKPCWRG